MKKLILLGAFAIFLGSAPDVFAQRHRGHDRIRRGVRSGQLTRDEARELRRDRRELRRERRAYRDDGTLTREERRELSRDRREFRRDLRRELRDDDRRDRRHYGWRNDRRLGNGYYRRGAGSPSHPVFGHRARNRYRY